MKKKEENQNKVKKPVYKKWWFWVIVSLLVAVIAVGIAAFTIAGSSDSETLFTNALSFNDRAKIPDFSDMNGDEIKAWAEENEAVIEFEEEYSYIIPKGSIVSQSIGQGENFEPGVNITIVVSLGEEPPQEYLDALELAEGFANTMYMSKDRIYRMLTKFSNVSTQAASYAINNLEDVDFKKNALERAKIHKKSGKSKKEVYDLLVADYGEMFTKEEAQYAVDHLPN